MFLQGGPCGVLASVQGFVLKHLLFGVNKGDVKKYVEVCSLCAELKSLFQPQAFAFICYCLLIIAYLFAPTGTQTASYTMVYMFNPSTIVFTDTRIEEIWTDSYNG